MKNLLETTQAVIAAYRRGETSFEGIPLPSIQKTGTTTQQVAHMEQLAQWVAKMSMEKKAKRPKYITIVWTIEDIACVVEGIDENLKLTDSRLMDILERVEHYHDACIGINWDVIQHHALEYLDDNGIEYNF